jgi:hypothetical protein
MIFFMAYKRNQIIEAIETTLSSDDQRAHIATRLKRLLHADRLLGRQPRSKHPEQSTYAFFSGELAGSGNENLYSPTEAFSLFLGLRLLENGFPQRVVIQILRLIRGELEGTLTSEWRQRQSPGVRSYLARLAPEGASSNTLAGVIGVCRGEDAVAKFLKKATGGQIMTVIELSEPMARFRTAIESTLPAKRGRR